MKHEVNVSIMGTIGDGLANFVRCNRCGKIYYTDLNDGDRAIPVAVAAHAGECRPTWHWRVRWFAWYQPVPARQVIIALVIQAALYYLTRSVT